MTSLSRRKHPTTPRARTLRAATIISVVVAWLGVLAPLSAQSFITTPPGNKVVTPKFVPSQPRPSGVVQASHTPQPSGKVILPVQGVAPRPGLNDDRTEPYVRTELPGPQRLFLRDSETEFFERISQEVKKQSGTRAIFPETPIISKEPYKARDFPEMVELVEPCYVCHRRLYFEQPNFERAGYHFGVLQPAICLGVFYYDLAMLPYHSWTDLHDRTECSRGKCLAGDPAPFLVPRERFSVTGAIGQTGAILGLVYLFP